MKNKNKNAKFVASESILEVAKRCKKNGGFCKKMVKHKFGIKEQNIQILNDEISKKLGQDIGSYITFQFDEMLFFDVEMREYLTKKLQSAISKLSKQNGKMPNKILVVGLGNEKFACDSLGKSVVSKILVTKPYLESELFEPSQMAEIYALSFGVYGTTGLETSTTIKAVCSAICPDVVIAIDSLVAGKTSYLASNIQVSDTKLMPGGGVGNYRKEVSQKAIGARVIAIGVPLVANLSSLCNCNQNLIVTPKDVEKKVSVLSKIIAKAINLSFCNLSSKEYLELTT